MKRIRQRLNTQKKKGRRYLELLDSAPLATKAVTAGALVVVGDAISQVAVERRSSYDWVRSGRMFAFGLCVSGPAMHYWYGFLGKRIAGQGLSKGIKASFPSLLHCVQCVAM